MNRVGIKDMKDGLRRKKLVIWRQDAGTCATLHFAWSCNSLALPGATTGNQMTSEQILHQVEQYGERSGGNSVMYQHEPRPPMKK